MRRQATEFNAWVGGEPDPLGERFCEIRTPRAFSGLDRKGALERLGLRSDKSSALESEVIGVAPAV
jgi:hypothetical protein